MQALVLSEGPQSPILSNLIDTPRKSPPLLQSSADKLLMTQNEINVDENGKSSTSSSFAQDSCPDIIVPNMKYIDTQQARIRLCFDDQQSDSKYVGDSNFTQEADDHHGTYPLSTDCEQLNPPEHDSGCSHPTDSAQSDPSESLHGTTTITTDLTNLTLNTPPSSNFTNFSLNRNPNRLSNDLSPSSLDRSIAMTAATLSPLVSDPGCLNCDALCTENDHLKCTIQRLRMRLHDALDTAQTHGQRLLRAAFQEKVREMATDHVQQTTAILNKQKVCFEEELDAMDIETRTKIQLLQEKIVRERAERHQLEVAFENEKNEAIEKTCATMQAVQHKIALLCRRVVLLESQKNVLSAAHKEKQALVEVLASAAAARDLDRDREKMLSEADDEERKRKNAMLDLMQDEIKLLRKQLGEEKTRNKTLADKLGEARIHKEAQETRHAEELANCKKELQKDSDRLGNLFASVIQDYTNAQSDVSSSD